MSYQFSIILLFYLGTMKIMTKAITAAATFFNKIIALPSLILCAELRRIAPSPKSAAWGKSKIIIYYHFYIGIENQNNLILQNIIFEVYKNKKLKKKEKVQKVTGYKK